MYSRIKSFRIISLITTVGLTIACFSLNFPEVSTNYYDISLTLSFLYILSWLTMSFIYGSSKNYITIASIYFGVILVATSLGMIFSYVQSTLKYILLIPVFIFLAPLAPLERFIPTLNDEIAVIFLILIMYVLVFFSHRLGRNHSYYNAKK